MSRARRIGCPREGIRVCLRATPAALALYGKGGPRDGECGTVRKVPVGFGRRTCMPGPGGGLVYVDWDRARFEGVFRQHLVAEKSGRALSRRKRWR